jgi:CheY-like chemotaxis protein
MISVLVVDDNQSIREVVGEVLRDAGYDAVEVAGGREALHWLSASPKRCVVLLDYNMPVMSGEQVLRAVASDPSLAGRHAFILTSAARSALDHVLDACPFPVEFLSKPFDIDDLIGIVNGCAAQLGRPGRVPQRHMAATHPTLGEAISAQHKVA